MNTQAIITILAGMALTSWAATTAAQSDWQQTEPRSRTEFQYPDGTWRAGGDCGGRLSSCADHAEKMCSERQLRAVRITPSQGEDRTPRVVSCGVPADAPSAATMPAAVSFIENCKTNLFANLVSDCGCIENTLQTLPSVPPGHPPADQPIKRAAEACVLDQDTLARNMAHSLREGPMAGHKECIGQKFAAAYGSNPVFNLRHIERLRGDAYKACIRGA